MVVRKRKKSRKLRGRTRTMGWGRIGQHRKSGSRGGVGAVGYHKHKWMWVIKYFPDWYGKKGFIPRGSEYPRKIDAINIKDLYELVEKLKLDNKLKVEDNKPVIDLTQLGYDKLLATGKADKPVKVIVKYASENAVRKIEAAGGEVIVLSQGKS